MDPQSMILLINAIARGVGGLAQLTALARRIQEGGVISDADIDAAEPRRDGVNERWNGAAQDDKP